MHDNTYIQTGAKDFFRSLEREPSISEAFVKLNVLDYRRAEKSDQKKRSNWVSIQLRQVACSKVVRISRIKVNAYEKVASIIIVSNK